MLKTKTKSTFTKVKERFEHFKPASELPKKLSRIAAASLLALTLTSCGEYYKSNAEEIAPGVVARVPFDKPVKIRDDIPMLFQSSNYQRLGEGYTKYVQLLMIDPNTKEQVDYVSIRTDRYTIKCAHLPGCYWFGLWDVEEKNGTPIKAVVHVYNDDDVGSKK